MACAVHRIPIAFAQEGLKRALLLRELGPGPEFTSLIPRLNEAATTISYECGPVYYTVEDDREQFTQRR